MPATTRASSNRQTGARTTNRAKNTITTGKEDQQHDSQENDHHSLTILWWRILRAIAVCNLVLWCVWASIYADLTSDYTSWHLVLSAIFTTVCAFRSFWPRIDLERYCIVDSYVSSMVIGRAAATIAEVSFATQVALLIDEFGASLGVGMHLLSVATVALFATAQIFCWFGMITRNHLWHAIEESLWALTFTVIGMALVWNAPSAPGTGSWCPRSVRLCVCCMSHLW